MRAFYSFLGILGIIALVIILSTNRRSAPEVIQRTLSQPGQPRSRPSIMAMQASPEPTEKVLFESVQSILPSRKSIREEVAKHPHETPESLLRFSEKLAPMMEEAQKNPAFAESLVGEFKDCAWDEQSPEVARALCLADARRLAKQDPALAPQVEQLDRGAPKRVRELAEVTVEYTSGE